MPTVWCTFCLDWPACGGINLKYRAEIDGLRALAVIPVILFHAGFHLFSGGYVGVDVFFVISGYLITTILITDIDSGRFSITKFYERRARRILPALCLVVVVCVPFAWMWMLPNQLEEFARSVVAVSLFGSNILFWRESGYFAAAAEEKPLLHTWSLAVEEQYYLFFPIFLFFAWRFGKSRVFWMIVLMSCASFILSEWAWRNAPSANFYLAPTRAWELLAGSIAAFIVRDHGIQKNNTLAFAGLGLILAAIFLFDETTPFPSAYALLPVFGTFLIVIYADQRTLAARILSWKPFVAIGLVSYSAYLWHQPLFAFAKIKFVTEVPTGVQLVLILLTGGLAWLSWRFVEQPFRGKQISRRRIFELSAMSMIVFMAIGISTPMLDKREFSHLDLEFASSISCSYPTGGYEDLTCGEQSPKAGDIIFVGDSLLNSSLEGIEAAATELDVEVFAIPKWDCPAVGGVTRFNTGIVDTSCSDFNQAWFNFLLTTEDNYQIVLYSAFNRYLSVGTAGSMNGDCAEAEDTCKAEFESALSETISALLSRGHEVTVVQQPPRYEIIGVLDPNGYYHHSGAPPTITLDRYRQDSRRFIDIVDGVGADIVSFENVFCDASTCSPFIEGQSYYVNGDHFGAIGAMALKDVWVQHIKTLNAPGQS